MMFSAVSGELLELNMGTATTCKLPLIKDLSKLLAIPDDEFLKYSDTERSNLVVRFSDMPLPMLASVTNLDSWFLQANHRSSMNAPAK